MKFPNPKRRKFRFGKRAKALTGPDVNPQTLAATQARRSRGIYLLPNAFTTAALFAAFYAIVQGMGDNFEAAAIGIFAAMVLDGMDGRVARLTGTQSPFGEQLDSLADMVSFGVAPALVMYEFVLHGLGRWGWLAAFTYCACAAFRLARFNTNLGVVDKRFFQGLPSPAAGALMAGFVWLAVDNKLPIKEAWMPWTAFALSIYAGLTMVSSAPFWSGKNLALKSVPFWVMVALLIVIVVISADPPITLFGLFCLYGLSGYGLWIWRRAKGLPGSPVAKPAPPDGAQPPH
jgi:CDP-diacylglycerol--serine O-phosphatidyltransferase